MAKRFVIPLDSIGQEAFDFVGPTPSERMGPAAAPKITPRDKPVLFRVLTWNNPDPPPQGRRAKIIQPEYDFNEISKATDTDGILRSSRDKQLVCIVKDPWTLGGKNPKTVAYIQRRLQEISQMSELSFSMVLRSCAQDLIEFGNFFLYLHRKEEFSTGRVAIIGGKKIDPIAAIHPLDITTMRPVLGDTVEIRGWYQTLENPSLWSTKFMGRLAPLGSDTSSIKYDRREIIHGYAWRRTGFIFGTPPAVPVLDDVRALRRLEEISEIVAHRHAFPLIHIAVGTEKIPVKKLPDGSTEIDVARDAYDALKMEGALITSERAKVTAITTKPLDLKPLLEHFTNRIVTGLGLSDTDIGRGSSANRGTATVLVKSLLERCSELQQIISDFILTQLFDVLLTEGGFEVTPENRVYLRFSAVDLERMMELGNYAANLYNSHCLTENEMREIMGRDPITEKERGGMFWELVQKPTAIINAADEPFTPAAKAALKNRVQPTNQFGTKKAKTTPMNDSQKILDCVKEFRDQIADYVEACVDQKKSVDDRKLWDMAGEASDKLLNCFSQATEVCVLTGFDSYTKETGSTTSFIYTGALRRRFNKHCIQTVLDKLIGDRENSGEFGRLVNKLRTLTDGQYLLKVVSFFDTWLPTWERSCGVLGEVAARFGLAQAAWIDGNHTVGWKGCADVRNLSPAQAVYHELVDCSGQTFGLVGPKTDQLNLSLRESTVEGSSCILKLASNGTQEVDLTKPGRRTTILLDSGERIMLPEEAKDGWEYDKNGTIRMPKSDSGTIEIWDEGSLVGKTRFVAPEPTR